MFRSVFYYIDINKPYCQQTDSNAGDNTEYKLNQLPVTLKPPSSTTKNKGHYKLVQNVNGYNVFLYSFDTTEAASRATMDSFGFYKEMSGKVDEFLPNPPTLVATPLKLIVDRKFCPESEVLQLQQLVEDLVDNLASPPSTDRDTNIAKTVEKIQTKVIVKVEVEEPTTNKWLVAQLKSTSLFDNYDIVDNKPGTGTDHFCRYHTSKEDFSIYPKEISTAMLAVANITIEQEDIDCLRAAGGDFKVKYNDSNKWQLLANMLKTASQMCLRAIQAGQVLFESVKVYGLLVDYESKSAKMAACMTLDLVKQNGSVDWAYCQLAIENSFMRLHTAVSQAIVPFEIKLSSATP